MTDRGFGEQLWNKYEHLEYLRPANNTFMDGYYPRNLVNHSTAAAFLPPPAPFSHLITEPQYNYTHVGYPQPTPAWNSGLAQYPPPASYAPTATETSYPTPPHSPNPADNKRPKPYKPRIRKSPHSFVFMVFSAITGSPGQMCTVAQIYDFISSRYPHFEATNGSWKNTVRHTLSFNDCFVKKARSGHGGHFWTVHPEATNMFEGDNFMRRLRRFKVGEKCKPGQESCQSAREACDRDARACGSSPPGHETSPISGSECSVELRNLSTEAQRSGDFYGTAWRGEGQE